MKNDKKLAEELKEWFRDANLSEPHFLYRNPVAILIHKELEKQKRWKKLNRGNK